MNWIDQVLQSLASQQPCGYQADGGPRSEPTALAAIALLTHEFPEAATSALDWLVTLQSAQGIVGPDASEPSPPWFTAPAVLAWQIAMQSADAAQHADNYDSNISAGVNALLRLEGKPIERNPEMGHDSTLIGWSWADNTHSWIEPTAWSLLALCAAGKQQHPRTREGRRLLVDRLLTDGGCNYGNTTVLGQELRPHLQSSGLALLALKASELQPDTDPRIAKTIDYLTSTLDTRTPTASLCYGLLGLAANDRLPRNSAEMLAAAADRTLRTDRSPLKLALLALAAKPDLIIHTLALASLSS